MRKRSFYVCGAILAFTWALDSARAGDGAIGIYFDPDCATCSGEVEIGVPFTLYVNATLAGATSEGMSGAEFRITGMPSGWYTTVTPNPLASIAVGDLFGTGANIAIESACSSSQQCVNLYTIWVGPTTSPVDLRLQVERALHYGCPWFCTPFLTGCDPYFTHYVATGGTAILNGPPCTVAVAPTTWSRVKQIYEH